MHRCSPLLFPWGSGCWASNGLMSRKGLPTLLDRPRELFAELLCC